MITASLPELVPKLRLQILSRSNSTEFQMKNGSLPETAAHSGALEFRLTESLFVTLRVWSLHERFFGLCNKGSQPKIARSNLKWNLT
jgi:hypothetical protein